MDAYRTLRNKVSAFITISKKESYQSKIEKGKSDPRTIWKIFKEFGMNNKECQNASKFSLKLDDQIITNESDLSEIFNNYCINIASKLKESIVETDFELLNNYVRSKVPTDIDFEIPLTNRTFIRQFLANLNVKKSTGLDNKGPRILKLTADVITPSLLYIVNKSISTGKFPSVWKEEKVKPLFKTGNKEDVNNYRPISILPTFQN